FTFLDGSADVALHGRPARERLCAPVISAAADRSVELDHHMAHFRRGAARASVELAPRNESASDPSAHKNPYQFARALACTQGVLAHNSHVHIVINEHGNVQ